MRRLIALALLLFGVTASTAAPPKLAVLGAGKTGWSDLLIARLSQGGDAVIVEREKLGAVLDEQSIQNLLGNRAERGRVGTIAGADLLVLLTESQGSVRLIVCDSHLGAKLDEVIFRTDRKPAEQVAAAMGDQTLRIARRFEGGIRQVVAVTDWVSRDLTFDYAYLQRDYGEFIRVAFGQIPGVAVVAIDEAKSIAEERDVAGTAQKDRAVPIFIEGEYRTKRGDNGEATAVQITLIARDSGKVLLERKLGPVPLEKAGPELLAVFGQDLAGLTKAAPPGIDAGGQFKLLVQRADEFRTAGDYPRSAALREAALLIAPDSDEQRVQVIKDYRERNDAPIQYSAWPATARQRPGDPYWNAVVAQVIGDWKRSLHHCEYMTRNHRLFREEAAALIEIAFAGIVGIRKVPCKPLEECETYKKEYLRQVYIRVASLDSSPRTGRFGLRTTLNPYDGSIDIALLRCDGNYYKPDDLDLLAELLCERLPETKWLPTRLFMLLRDVGETLRQDSHSYRFTEKQYVAFLDRLAASDRQLPRLYGRYGKLCLRRYGAREDSLELAQEGKAIIAEIERLDIDLRPFAHVLGLLNNAMSQRAGEVQPSGPALNPAIPGPRSAQGNTIVSLVPIELKFDGLPHAGQMLTPDVLWRGPSGSSGISAFRQLGEGLDALLAGSAVLFIQQTGKVKEVLANTRLKVSDVIADDRYVWVAGAYDWGLTVLDRQGNALVHITREQGLPPCDRFGMVVHPIEPGRILAAGCFGNEHRAWIAIVEFDGQKPKVEVIHEATKVPPAGRDDRATQLDPATCFVPAGMFEHVYHDPTPRRILFVLGRSNPLLVDPQTRKVRVYPADARKKEQFPRIHARSGSFLSIAGVLWVAGPSAVGCYRYDDKTGMLVPVGEDRSAAINAAGDGKLARSGDWLYLSGLGLRRINLKTGEMTVLSESTKSLPGFGRQDGWNVMNSHHYGLVTLCNGTLYQLRMGLNEPNGNPPATGPTPISPRP